MRPCPSSRSVEVLVSDAEELIKEARHLLSYTRSTEKTLIVRLADALEVSESKCQELWEEVHS